MTSTSSYTARPYSFAQVHTKHGPTALIGRLLLQLEQAARDRGIFLSIETMDDLLDINKRSAPGWLPLVPLYDPTYNDLDSSNSFAIIGRDINGRVVATQAARGYDWTETDFTTEASSLRLFYKEPHKTKLNGERCSVSAVVGRQISGSVAFSGAAWNHPDWRSKGLVQILPRIARLYALTLWEIDFAITMMARPLVQAGVFDRCGYGNLEWGVQLRNTRVGNPELALIWIKNCEIISECESFLKHAAVSRQMGQNGIVHDRKNLSDTTIAPKYRPT